MKGFLSDLWIGAERATKIAAIAVLLLGLSGAYLGAQAPHQQPQTVDQRIANQIGTLSIQNAVCTTQSEQLQQQLAAVTKERDELKEKAKTLPPQ